MSLYVAVSVFLVAFVVLKMRLASHVGGLGQLALAALAAGLAVWPVVQVVRFFSGCACG